MNTKKYNKIMSKLGAAPRSMTKAAKLIVKNADALGEEPLGEEFKPIIAAVIANSMKFGEEMTKKKHYVRGFIAGGLICGLTASLITAVKMDESKTEMES